jgi:hypothetical protein
MRGDGINERTEGEGTFFDRINMIKRIGLRTSPKSF